MSQFIAGPEIQSPLVAGDLTIAPFICYEIVYPDFVQRHAANADVLITISNDTWFGRSIGPWQHFQMARFRAAELGRDLIRGTNDGISALITADGAISVTASQFSESVITGSIQPRSGHTPLAPLVASRYGFLRSSRWYWAGTAANAGKLGQYVTMLCRPEQRTRKMAVAPSFSMAVIEDQ
ncbi:MAG: hypothetical protein CM15mP74_34400 [Halieaceae bacterium]|nr:MAG: hypothetical protein CM15mP74_34400 [Halieaceae bacterium]